jgi:heptaprenyl diphosphate synthase
MTNVKTLTTLSMMLAAAIVLNVIEMQLNIIPVPGAKIGFANLVTVIVLYLFDFKKASLVTILRVLLVGLLYRSFTVTFWMGLSGAIFSIITMGIMKKWFRLHIVTISVFGAIFHNIGQIIAGIYLLEEGLLVYYLPFMLFISVPAGFLIGVISNRFLQVYSRNFKVSSF